MSATEDVAKTTGAIAQITKNPMAVLGTVILIGTALLAAELWVFFTDLRRIDQDLRELKIVMERSIAASDRRFNAFQETQTTWHGETKDLLRSLISAMTASCYAAANGDPEARVYCDRIGRAD